MSTPQPTQSHLLNRLLQRQIGQLESENATLKARVAKLETRVTDSTAKQRAINGTAADDITRATVESQTVSRETERAAKLMVQQLQHPQNRLVEAAKEVQHEQKRLAHVLTEFYSTLDTLPNHAKRDVAALIRTAHTRQESLLAQLAELYDPNGLFRHSESQTRLNARQVEEQATAHRQHLTKAIEREQSRHSAKLTYAHEQSRELSQLLNRTTEQILKLQAAIQKEPTTLPEPTPAAKPTPTPTKATVSTPHHEEQVLETARRAIAEDATPPPAPAVAPKPKTAGAMVRAPYDNESYRAVPKSGAVAVPPRPRPLLQIGIALAAFVVVLIMIATLM
jgi:hypothetical protein